MNSADKSRTENAPGESEAKALETGGIEPATPRQAKAANRSASEPILPDDDERRSGEL